MPRQFFKIKLKKNLKNVLLKVFKKYRNKKQINDVKHLTFFVNIKFQNFKQWYIMYVSY